MELVKIDVQDTKKLDSGLLVRTSSETTEVGKVEETSNIDRNFEVAVEEEKERTVERMQGSRRSEDRLIRASKLDRTVRVDLRSSGRKRARREGAENENESEGERERARKIEDRFAGEKEAARLRVDGLL